MSANAKLQSMPGIEEIEQAIEKLSAQDLTRLSEWIFERDQTLWDRQLDTDSQSGKLDALFEEASGPGLPPFPPTR